MLKGLVFLGSPQEVKPNGETATGIVIRNVAMLQRTRFRAQVAPYLGQPVTFDGLNDIALLVVNFYRAHHHPLVDAVIPEQDISRGTVQIVVTEFRVGAVRVEGNNWFSTGLIETAVSLHHGDTVDSRELLSDLDAANANSFRQVSLVYRPDEEPGYTDLVLHTRDRFPVRVYGGYDNSGTPVTGRSRWSLGFNWGNVLGRDQQLSYQFTSSNDFWNRRSSMYGERAGPSLVAHSLSWTTPLPSGHSLMIFGSYEQSVPNIGQHLGLVGRSGQASFRYHRHLPRTESFVQALEVGYDFKTTDNNLDFGGTTVSHNTTEVDQFPLTYLANFTDRWGIIDTTTMLVYSPGGVTPNNNDTAFQPAPDQSGRPGARANYLYLRSEINRLTKLPGGATWAFRWIGQLSNRKLLYSEQLSAGGPDILRGYDPYAVLGDQGVVLSNELRTPALHLLPTSLGDRQQFIAFWDYASLHNKHPVEGDGNRLHGSSIGVGLRYGIRSHLALKLDFGWPLQRLPEAQGHGQFASISMMIGY